MKLWKLAVLVGLLGLLVPNLLGPCSFLAVALLGFDCLRLLAREYPLGRQFSLRQLLVLTAVAGVGFAVWRWSPHAAYVGGVLVVAGYFCLRQVWRDVRELRERFQARRSQ